MKRRRIRFKCAVCLRWRGHTRLACFMGKLRPVCEPCAMAMERARNLEPEDAKE